MRLPITMLLATAACLSPAIAGAWDSPEHSAFGWWAIDVACDEQQAGTDACSDDNKELAACAVAAPDYCHSFWFSDVGIQVNDDDADSRAGCGIRYGVANPNPSSLNYITYVLMTNPNHFGDNTQTHFQWYHKLALQAAHLGSTLPAHYQGKAPNDSVADPNPLIGVCTKAAIGLEGFALHYLTDRTAAGHAWNPEPNYTPMRNLHMDGLRGCFHGQGFLTREGVALWTGFSCVDSTGGLDGSIHASLGGTGRRFGGDQWSTGDLWLSDETFFYNEGEADAELAGGPASYRAPAPQGQATLDPAVQAFAEVLATLAGSSSPEPAWTDTFVSDYEFCRVALSECCRNPTDQGLGQCLYCEPDITDAHLKAQCPVDQVRSAPISGADWVPIEVTRPIVPPRKAPGDPGWQPWIYYAHLNFSESSGDKNGAGIGLARGMALTGAFSVGSVHPDAVWDQQNDVVTLTGCAQFDIVGANLPAAAYGGIPADGATVTYQGNPKFPLTVYFQPDDGCVAPNNVPDLCQLQSYEIPTKPVGTTASSPMPLSIPWACPVGLSGAAPASVPGALYIVDSNGSWTPTYDVNLVCTAPPICPLPMTSSKLHAEDPTCGPPPPGDTTGDGTGDPHLLTFDGERYDCQPWGEETLVVSAAGDLEVQVRTHQLNSENVAVIVAEAARVGTDRLVFYLDGTATLDGVSTTFGQGGTSLPAGGAVWNTARGYVLVWPDTATQLWVTNHGFYLGAQVFLADARRGHVTGLFGNANGDPADDLTTRDGSTTLTSPAPFDAFYKTYVQSWRVTQATSLFDYQSGENTGSPDITNLNFPAMPQTVQDLSSAQVQSATAICQKAGVASAWIDDCVLDVALSNGDARAAEALVGAPTPVASFDIAPPGSAIQQCGWTTSDETLNGSAVVTNTGILRLTNTAGYVVGSAFWNHGVAWDPTVSFSTFFALDMGPNIGGGDGLAFVIQASAPGPKALGSAGGYLGYGGGSTAIKPSIAVEFDTYQNGWDPNANHVALLKNGDVTTHLQYATPSFTLASAANVFAWIDYDAPSTTISVYASAAASKPAAPLFTYAIDVAAVLGSGPAYVGFSAGTGLATNNEDVHQWTWSVGGAAVTCSQ